MKINKKIFISTLFAGVALSTSTLFAESTDISVPMIPEITAVPSVPEKSEAITTNSLTRIKARGAALIKERVGSLNTTGATLSSSKTLSLEQKAVFSTAIASQVAGLTTLGTSISSGTDASSTKALVASIFSTFRIYAVVMPQIRLEKRINDLQNHAAKLADVFTKIQTNIDAQKAKGKDVTTWQAALDNAKALVVTDTTKLAALFTQISAMKPADYPTTSKTTIDAVNVGIKAVAKDFMGVVKVARAPHDMHMVMNASSTVTH
jgi:hypothetical protein